MKRKSPRRGRVLIGFPSSSGGEERDRVEEVGRVKGRTREVARVRLAGRASTRKVGNLADASSAVNLDVGKGSAVRKEEKAKDLESLDRALPSAVEAARKENGRTEGACGSLPSTEAPGMTLPNLPPQKGARWNQ